MVRKRRVKRLRFSTRIYKKKAIKNAILDYSKFARFKTRDIDNNYLEVKIENISNKFKNSLIYEFSNYVLALTKKCL